MYVTGNLLLFYERGNRRRHVSPDVFVVHGVPKLPRRDYYLLWEEGRGPDVVIEITSKTTRHEDQVKKRALPRRAQGPGVLPVRPDRGLPPAIDARPPPGRGSVRTDRANCRPAPQHGARPSPGASRRRDLRLYDPTTGQYLMTPKEQTAESRKARRAEADRRHADEAREHAEEARQRAEEARQRGEEAQHARRRPATREEARQARPMREVRPRRKSSGSAAARSLRGSVRSKLSTRADQGSRVEVGAVRTVLSVPPTTVRQDRTTSPEVLGLVEVEDSAAEVDEVEIDVFEQALP